ncbi:uncharacterized protein LOC115880071 [Sitophilus oryzae]|uniref:Uncharacterized protein LOC115880071 n=1 Tax=Sitophilus oryzae TaxID=7048 RepID=A0A6J2XPQ5_SITOR|nr:uncharacterized protein LOC115880071 [Sitophilus oryzae]
MVLLGVKNILFRIGVWLTIVNGILCQYRSQFNPSIIHDARLEPKVDGTFGFAYRTEDGISHAAQGDPTGFIQGSYSYKDPTGLKVNFNYFAGSRNAPSNPAPRYPEPSYNQVQEQPAYDDRQIEDDRPVEPYVPRTRPPSTYYNKPQSNYPRYTSTSRDNEVYEGQEQYRG